LADDFGALDFFADDFGAELGFPLLPPPLPPPPFPEPPPLLGEDDLGLELFLALLGLAHDPLIEPLLPDLEPLDEPVQLFFGF